MPEISGQVFDSENSASFHLRNNSEADTADASVMKTPRRRNLAGLFFCDGFVCVPSVRGVVLA
jgi:hypothetical protein